MRSEIFKVVLVPANAWSVGMKSASSAVERRGVEDIINVGGD